MSTPAYFFLAALSFHIVLGAAAVYAEKASAQSPASRYWHVRDDLPPARQRQLAGYCAGAYVKPRFAPAAKGPLNEQPVHGEAQSAEYWVDGKVTLTGNVKLQQGNRTVTTHQASLDTETLEAVLTGGVLFEEPFVAIQGEGAELNLDTKAADLDDVQFFLFQPELRGDAQQLLRDELGTLALKDAEFTRCEPGNNGWRINSSRMTVEEGAIFATARNATVRMKGVPIFYTPYIRFPVSDDRQSGFLFPSIEYSGSEGLDLTLPYYFNLAPNYDATLSPRYIGKRGINLEGEFRHLSSWQTTTLNAAILPDDDLFDGTFDKDDFADAVEQGLVAGEFKPADRWLYGMRHQGRLGHFSSRVNYTAVSDRDYFRDLGSDLGVSSRIDLERVGELQYARGGFFARVWAQRFQRLDEVTTDPYQRLPELELGYSGRLVGPLEYSLGAEWVSFTRNNDDLRGLNAVVGDRLHLEPRLRLPFSWTWGFLTFAGGYRYTQYDLQDAPPRIDDKPDRSIGLGSVEGGLFFDREVNLFGAEMVQTLEPRVYYLYQEFADQRDLPRFDVSEFTIQYDQLFRDNRFTGLDRIGDANQLTVGVTSRLMDSSSGRELLRASIGQIKYFSDRRVTLSGPPDDDDRRGVSAMAGELSWSVTRSWRVRGTLVWDTGDGQVDEAAGSVQYRSDNRHIFNVGYRKRKSIDVDQTDLSVYWPVGRRFGVLGRWNYDLVSDRTIEALAGIEYNDCCWQLRLVARHFLDSPTSRSFEDIDADKGIFLQIVFKGLAGVGGTLESVMQRGIKGYQSEANHGY
jgi:LPS-assembly protein